RWEEVCLRHEQVSFPHTVSEKCPSLEVDRCQSVHNVLCNVFQLRAQKCHRIHSILEEQTGPHLLMCHSKDR
ncbi:unnamed protein product, partial [Bubo scandiacus]